MPYELKHPSPRCWSVVNTETGEVHSKCSTKQKAEAQMRLLYGVETGWKPSTNYREFVSREMKKRPSGVKATGWMKTIGAKWQSIKKKP